MLNNASRCYIFPDMKRLLMPALLLLVAAAAWAQTTERELFLEAEGRYQAGDYVLALDLYNSYIKSYPLSSRVPDIEFRRAVSMFRIGDTHEALSLFKTVEVRYPQTRFLPYVPFWIGLCDYQLKDYHSAIRSFDRYLGGNDETVRNQALLYKAVSEKEVGRPHEARLTLVKLMNRLKDPTSEPYALTELAALRLKGNDYQGVLDLLNRIDLSSLPKDTAERLDLYKAEAYYGLQHYSSAEPLYRRLLTAPPSIASIAYQRLFSIYQSNGEQSKLTAIVNRADLALAGMPAVLEDFWLRVGIDSYKQGKLDLAESYLQRIRSLRSQGAENPLVPLYLAEIYSKTKRLPQAISLLKGALPHASEYQDLMLFRLAGFQLEAGDYASAHTSYREFLSRYRKSSYYGEAAYLDAYASFKLENYAAVVSRIDHEFSAGRAGTYHAKMLKLRALALTALGEKAKAIQSLREYLPLAPDDIAARIDLAKLYFDQQDYSSLLEENAKLLKAHPNLEQSDAAAYLTVRYLDGLALLSQKHYADALKMLAPLTPHRLHQAELSDIAPYSLFYQGWAVYRLGDYGRAASLFAEVLSSTPKGSLADRARYMSGWTAYLRNDYRRAAGFFRTYADEVSSSERDKGLYMYAKSLESEGKLEAAAHVFQGIFTESPKSDYADDAMFEYAGVLAAEKKVDQAAAVYKRLAASYPGSPLVPTALYKRAELFYNHKMYNKARSAFAEYRGQFPNGEKVAAALYWGGRSSLAAGEDFGAVLLWQKLIAAYPKSGFRADAMDRSAGVYSQRGDLHRALKLYSELESAYPKEAKAMGVPAKAQQIRYVLSGQSKKEAQLLVTIGKDNRAQTKAGRKAMVQLARIYIYESASKQDQAVPLLKEVIAKKGEDAADAAQAEYLLGQYYYQASDLQKAANSFLSAATLDPSNRDLTASSLYRAAEMAKLAGNPSDAATMVKRIEKEFPNSEWAVEAKKLLGGAQ